MKDDNGVAPVVGTAQEQCQLCLRHLAGHLGNLSGRFAQRIFALFILGNVEKKARFFEARTLLFPGVDDSFDGGLFFENGLGFFAVVPEVWLGCERSQLFDALLLAGDVKAASAKALRALQGGSIVHGFLRALILLSSDV